MYKNLTTICAAAALALGLAACGGGGGGDTVQTGGGGGSGGGGQPVTLASLQGGMIVPPGTYEISGDAAALMAILDDLGALTVPDGGYAPGAEVMAGSLTLQCSPNSAANCNLTINDDGTVTTTGTILVATTGTMLPDYRTDDQKRADTESNVNVAFGAATTAVTDSEGAEEDANTALDTATEKSGMLTAVAVQGDSAMAAANAQSVLDQPGNVASALEDANTAKTNAETARNTAVGDPAVMGDTGNVPTDHPQRAELITALNAAIEDAGDAITAIEGIRDGDPLKTAVEMVTKNDDYGYAMATDDDPEMLGTARRVGEKVAMDIATVLKPATVGVAASGAAVVNTIGNNPAGTDGADDDPIFDADGRLNFVDGPIPLAADNPASAHVFYRDNEVDGRVSMTWEELATSLGFQPIWVQIGIGAATDGTQLSLSARGILVDGEDSIGDITTAATTTADATIAERAVFDGASWKGLNGLFVCWGGPCDVTGDTGSEKLASATTPVGSGTRTGHWYFVPQSGPAANFSATNGVEIVETFHPSGSRSRYYVANPATAGTYIIDTMYARLGFWLDDEGDHDNDAATPDTYRMSRFAVTAGTPSDAAAWTVNTAADATTLTDTSATYTGRAGGMSVLMGMKADGERGPIRSGTFGADVELTATFSATATEQSLSGRIDGFDGPAVNTGWVVTLSEVAIGTNTAGQPDNGEAEGSGPGDVVGQNGAWTATAYGPAGARPAGITGTFDAHFADGDAAGVYATRKQ